MTDQPTHDDQYQKLHDHLLSTNQQELAGHLDTLWQELGRLRTKDNQGTKLIQAISTADPDSDANTVTEDSNDGASGWGYKKTNA